LRDFDPMDFRLYNLDIHFFKNSGLKVMLFQ
jgi:hypothetical protein